MRLAESQETVNNVLIAREIADGKGNSSDIKIFKLEVNAGTRYLYPLKNKNKGATRKMVIQKTMNPKASDKATMSIYRRN